MKRLDEISRRMPWCVVCNLLLLYAMYMLCRVVFLLVNYNMFGDSLSASLLWRMAKGGFMFDSSAIFYTNLPYLLIVLLPLHLKEKSLTALIAKWLYVAINALALLANLADALYFPFSGKRTTLQLLSEFADNTNTGSVIGAEIFGHWYLWVLYIAMVWVLVRCYRGGVPVTAKGSRGAYYVRYTLSLLVIGVLAVAGMRGSFFTRASRPIAMSNAHQYVDTPTQAAVVLNTPFSIVRSLSRKTPEVPRFFADDDVLATYYSAVHLPTDSMPRHKNVVILIVESFAEEFIGARNRDLDNGTYRGYTTFTDSLLEHSLTFERTYANGWISIDAMPAVLSSIPKMYDSFVLTPYAMDDSPGIAKELKTWGYTTAFFHGAENSSMGFQAMAHAAGFDRYYGRDEFYADGRFGGKDAFDGTWAIWDEEFLQFFCAELTEMKQPFLASVFTASSHHPFNIPERYKDRYPDEGAYPLHKCIRYTDNALRLFFAAARRQPWFENTLFVITADHASSRVTHDVYKTPIGEFRVPIIFYDPSGKLPVGTQPGVAQQIDIMPTVLGILGYDKPYIAFGKDLLHKGKPDSWAFNWHNIPQYVKGDWLIQYDGFNLSGVYDLAADPLMQNNLKPTGAYNHEDIAQMENELKAIMQDVYQRLRADSLRLK